MTRHRLTLELDFQGEVSEEDAINIVVSALGKYGSPIPAQQEFLFSVQPMEGA